MVQFRPTAREIVAKIVYYGPPLGGKTTNLRMLHAGYPEEVRGSLIELPAGHDRTIYFDYLPLTLRQLRGMDLRIQLYTVPGQVRFDATRQLVLKGVDGVVFVADSQRQAMQANRESWANLKKNLALQGLFLDSLPHVLQYNKRDLPDIATVEELDSALNEFNAPFFEAVAIQGIGVEEILQAITKLVVRSLRDRFNLGVIAQQGLQAVPPPETEELVTRPVSVTPKPLPREEFAFSEPLPPPEITPPTLPLVSPQEPEAVVLEMPASVPAPAEFAAEAVSDVRNEVFVGENQTPAMPLPEPEFVMPEATEQLPLAPLPEDVAEPGLETGGPPAEAASPAPWEEPQAPPGPDSGLTVDSPLFASEPQGEAFSLPLKPEPPAAVAGEPFVPSWQVQEASVPFQPESEATGLELGETGIQEAPFLSEASGQEVSGSVVAPAADPFVVEELPTAGSSEDVFAMVPRPQVEVTPEAAAIERVIPRAVARHGELRELEVEVPVPATWVGGRRVTLQLRLTLVPEEEDHEL